MCFSPEISGTFFVMGTIVTVYTYLYQSKFAKYNYFTIGFYTLMELLQTLQYFFVNDCESKWNVVLTNVAYVFVIVQPLMWNTLYFYRSKGCSDRNIFKLAIILCIVWILWNVIMRVMYREERDAKYAACGGFTSTKTCTLRDPNKHLYWQWTSAYVPGVSAEFFMYLALWFVPALISQHEFYYGFGLMLTAFFTVLFVYMYGGRYEEFPSTWCLTSIPFAVFSLVSGMKP